MTTAKNHSPCVIFFQVLSSFQNLPALAYSQNFQVVAFIFCIQSGTVTFRRLVYWVTKPKFVSVINCVWLFSTLWTAACQAPLSVGFSTWEYWSGLPLPSPGCLPDPGTEPVSPALAGESLTTIPPGKPNQSLSSLKKQSILLDP